MSPLAFKCIACQLPAEDEYHWYTDDGQEIVWRLCEGHCEFALEVSEFTLSYLDEWGTGD